MSRCARSWPLCWQRRRRTSSARRIEESQEMAGKGSAAAVLAEKMVQRLRALRALVSDSYPVTLKRLAELTDPTAATKVILDAVNPQRKAFSQHALVARKDLLAPVALKEDEQLLAASPLLLEFLLETTRTASSHAASVAKLKGK